MIASAIGPVMEVCGDAALFFNPYSPIEMKMKLVQSINDPSFITNTQPRINQYQQIRLRQMSDLDYLSTSYVTDSDFASFRIFLAPFEAKMSFPAALTFK